jgi:hypothetical protein
MGERIRRIGRIQTDFLGCVRLKSVNNPQKIRLDPPNPPNPFSHRISTFQSGNYGTPFNPQIRLLNIFLKNNLHFIWIFKKRRIFHSVFMPNKTVL